MTRFVLVVVAAAGVAAGAVWLGVRAAASDEAAPAPATTTTANAATPAATSRTAPAGRAAPAMIAPATTDRLTATLAADLVDRDPVVRAAAVAELAASSEPDPATLTAASRDPDLRVSAAAVAGLSKLYARGEVVAQPLLDLVTDRSVHERVRGQALNGLAVAPTAETAALLLELLARGDDLERRSAAILLARQDPEVAMAALIDALADRDEIVRANAHEALVSRSRGRDFGMDAAAWRAWWHSRARR
jgi:hypothetical protein